MLNRILSILFLLLSFASTAQKKQVVLSVTPKDAEVGETVVITVETNIKGEIALDNLPSSFSYGASSGSQMYQRMDYGTGKVITFYSISQSGVITKPGTYKIGPAYVKSRGRAHASNTVNLTVSKKTPMSNGTITQAMLNEPAFGVVQTSKSTIYEGESVVVSAKIYAKYQPTNIYNYNSFVQAKALESHSLSRSVRLKVHEEVFRGINYFAFEHDKHVVFPLGTGNFEFGPYTVDVLQGPNGYTVTSNNIAIRIKPLPPNPPSDFIGGVGQFTIERQLDTTEIKQGDVFVMLIIIEGTGNIQNILAPTLQLPKGFLIYGDPVVSENITYGARGAEGIVSYEYNVQVSSYGELKFPTTTVSYFDPDIEQYVQVGTEENTIKVTPDENFITSENSDKSNSDEALLELIPELRKKKEIRFKDTLYGSPVFWSGVSVPVLCAFFFLIFTRRREQSSDKIEARQIIRQKDKELGDFVNKGKSLIESDPNDEFFSSIEAGLRKAFEVKMNVQQERILGKTEVSEFLTSSGEIALSDRVQKLFRTCEESRYAYGAMDGLRKPSFDEFTSILKALKL